LTKEIWPSGQDFSHSPGFRGKEYYYSAKASRGEDLDIQAPIHGGYSPAAHVHATVAGMPGPTLVGHQLIQERKPRQKRLLAPIWMMEPFHREPFRRDGVVGVRSCRSMQTISHVAFWPSTVVSITRIVHCTAALLVLG
jgi:hypothetical protein